MFCNKLFNWNKNKKTAQADITNKSAGRRLDHIGLYESSDNKEGSQCHYPNHMQQQEQYVTHNSPIKISSTPQTPTQYGHNSKFRNIRNIQNSSNDDLYIQHLASSGALHQQQHLTATVRSPSAIRRVHAPLFAKQTRSAQDLTRSISPSNTCSPIQSPVHTSPYNTHGKQSPSPFSDRSGSLNNKHHNRGNGTYPNQMQHSNSHSSPLHNTSTATNAPYHHHHQQQQQHHHHHHHPHQHNSLNRQYQQQQQNNHKGYIIEQTYSQPFAPPALPSHPPPPLPYNNASPPLPPGHPGK